MVKWKVLAAVVGVTGLTCLTAAAGVTVSVIDCVNGNGGSTVSGAIFRPFEPQPTGTGYIDPFLREQANGSELGVNTSIKGQIMDTVAYDNKDPLNYTHDLAISTLSQPNPGYYRFMLDANQSGNDPISLIRFQIYVSPTAFTDASALASFLANQNNVDFDMNKGNQRYRVDITSDHGSGSGDMWVDVPVDKIGTSGYLYLVAGFGALTADNGSSGYATDDGFEEWWVRTSVPVPDAASGLTLLGIALAGIEVLRRKIKA